MKNNVVLTFIGEDKPGLVESISGVINDYRGNWLESRLCQLAGRFAGIVHVNVDENQTDGLVNSLKGLQEKGLTVVVERGTDARQENRHTHTLTLLGLDRPGIVRDVSSALAGQNINVLELNTNIVKAAMTGEPMFDAKALVEYAADTDLDRLAVELETISTGLGVDIELDN